MSEAHALFVRILHAGIAAYEAAPAAFILAALAVLAWPIIREMRKGA